MDTSKPKKNKYYEISWRRVKTPWLCHTINEEEQTANLVSKDRKTKVENAKWADLKPINTP